MLPNFIGIGAPKAGTTWLFKCLQEHPQIYMAPAKETNFFDYATVEGRLSEYEDHFAGVQDEIAIGEISTRYLTSTRAPQRIRELMPQVKLFVSLRNPIEQVYSHYWHLQRQNFHQWGLEKIPHSFEQALTQYEAKLVEPALYAQHLKKWLELFGRSQIHILLFDDIRSTPEHVLSDLYHFLGVDSALVPVSLHERGSDVRQGVSPKSPGLDRIYRRLYDLLNRRVYYPAKNVFGVQNAIRIKDKFKIRNLLERAFFQTGYPPMRAETRAWLYSRFSKDIHETEQLMGQSLGEWK